MERDNTLISAGSQQSERAHWRKKRITVFSDSWLLDFVDVLMGETDKIGETAQTRVDMQVE